MPPHLIPFAIGLLEDANRNIALNLLATAQNSQEIGVALDQIFRMVALELRARRQFNPILRRRAQLLSNILGLVRHQLIQNSVHAAPAA